MGEPRRVIVIGGGIIGLTAAWSLTKRGAKVIVLDERKIGQSASGMNTGWITPTLSTPLASPGILAEGLRHAADRDGALVIRPRIDLTWARWLYRFRQAAQPTRYRHGVSALLELNRRTPQLYDRLTDDLGATGLQTHSAGLLALALQRGGLSWFERLFTDLEPLGFNDIFSAKIERLDGTEARLRDPAVGDRVTEAIWCSVDRHVEPISLLRGLQGWLRNQYASVIENEKATQLSRNSAGWWVHTERTDGEHQRRRADTVLVCAGVASTKLLRPYGVRLAIVGGKGYSADVRGIGTPPQHSLYLAEAKLGTSTYQDSVRIAGTFELPGRDTTIPDRRITQLLDGARPYLGAWSPDDKVSLTAHAGLRPCTPDGLPYIGAVPGHDGLYGAAGHNMLGITLAPATGEAIADLIYGHGNPGVLAPFAMTDR